MSAVPAQELRTYQQRADYRTALDHLTAGRTGAFQRTKARLQGYVLSPYLDYYELQSRLSVASAGDVHRFRAERAELPVAEIVFWRWLKRLGQRRDWQRFLKYYEPAASAEMRCYHLRALYGSGRKEEAFAGVGELWVVGKSQPKACDPLFDVWIANDHLTDQMAWARLRLALENNQRQLARYLLRFFQGNQKPWAQSLYNLHSNPSAIVRTGRYATDTTYSRHAIRHGLLRLAKREPADAAEAWRRYRKSHDFDDAQRTELDDAIMMALADSGEFPSDRRETAEPAVAEAMAKAALTHQRWGEVRHWIDQLPTDTRAQHRWQYWLARALAASTLDSERARLAYRALAEQRDYYGFLAAERLGLEPRLNRNGTPVTAQALAAAINDVAVARILELYAVGDLINARRELNALIPKLVPAQQGAVAQLMMDVGWISQGIAVANLAKLRDHLSLRFPQPYASVYQQVSHGTTVPYSYLIAVTRQESAFDPRARSSANARGLMQLLPSTASAVARRTGLPSPATVDLYIPHTNITLGGHHLAELLLRYDNSRPLAAAAYNAGRHRVDRWTKDAQGLPMDIWIETIPFRETRNYVKNVLAFAQVYGQLLNLPTPMLHAHEATVP